MGRVTSFSFEAEMVQKANKEAKETTISMAIKADVIVGGDYQTELEVAMWGSPLTMEMRRIGEVVYANTPTMGTWMEMERRPVREEELSSVDPAELVPYLENVAVQFDDLNGHLMYRINGTVLADEEPATAAIWVDVDELLLRKMEVEGYSPQMSLFAAGGAPEAEPGMYTLLVIHFSRYHEPLTIQVPDLEPEPTPTPTFVPATRAYKLAFARGSPGTGMDIYLMNADGSNQLRLTDHQEADTEPAWSPDGSLIAFACYRDDNLEICTMGSDGANQMRLTHNDVPDSHPRWSPDGIRIAFESDSDGNSDIYVMGADGSDLTRLTDNPGIDWLPSWSPDGRWILYGSERESGWEICVVDVDGSSQTCLTDNDVDDTYHEWSPDGSRIVFSSERDGNAEIYVVNADGSDPTRLTHNPGGDWKPAWSPDGSMIAFVSERDELPGIYVMRADGSQQTRITGKFSETGAPLWSPDGLHIALVSVRDWNMEIYILDADGSNLKRLTKDPAMDWELAWSPLPMDG